MEGTGICDWEAQNAEVVKEIVKKVLGSPPTDPTIVVENLLSSHMETLLGEELSTVLGRP